MLDIAQEIADRWGHLFGTRGATVPVIDGLLAAMAIHHNLTLVTRNTKDMARTGVALFNPWSDKGHRRSGYANELLELRASLHEAAHGLSRGA
jgi:hypothetical protein